MAIPETTKIPSSSGQFAKLQEGANKYRVLSDVVIGWEGWKDGKPFRHEGAECKIKDEDVEINKMSGKPAINYFWAMVVWNYGEEALQVLTLTQKTIMGPLYELEKNEDWGDLKNYDIQITKKKDADKTSYTVIGIPPKAVAKEITEAYKETDIDLGKLFDGEYPIKEGKEDKPF